MEPPTLSICIPAYKRPADLQQCLTNLVSQPAFQEKWVELIIGDDAPDKPVTKIVAPFQKKYGLKKIKYFLNTQNLGFEKNILKCLEKAQHEYVFFMTDDDCFTPQALAKIKTLLHDHPNIDFFTSTYLTQHENGEVCGKYQIYPTSRYITQTPADTALLFGICNDLSGKCFRKKYFSVSGYSRHFGSMYPHLYPLGELILTKKTYYEIQPLFIQTIGNFTYWKYPPDYCIGALFKIIEDVGRSKPAFVQLAKKKLILNCPYIIYLNLAHPKKLFVFLRYLIQYHILTSPRNWGYLLEGAGQIIKEKISSFTQKTASA
jgi:glycosyltransferase involved in cell wall biosynthesis